MLPMEIQLHILRACVVSDIPLVNFTNTKSLVQDPEPQVGLFGASIAQFGSLHSNTSTSMRFSVGKLALFFIALYLEN